MQWAGEGTGHSPSPGSPRVTLPRVHGGAWPGEVEGHQPVGRSASPVSNQGGGGQHRTRLAGAVNLRSHSLAPSAHSAASPSTTPPWASVAGVLAAEGGRRQLSGHTWAAPGRHCAKCFPTVASFIAHNSPGASYRPITTPISQIGKLRPRDLLRVLEEEKPWGARLLAASGSGLGRAEAATIPLGELVWGGCSGVGHP